MSENNRESATLGGGCFWCLEAVFEQVTGVESVVSGYCGGQTDNPSYRSVCEGHSGHAEVVRIAFDPARISYRDLLEIFFVIHDPTTPNRQGNDIGTQYRSVIFYHSAAQKETADALIRELENEKIWGKPVVTEVRPEERFFVAEDYHQHYFSNNPDQGYCQVVVAPKLAKFRKKFSSRIRTKS
ncbi:MAG: peptide-methionine (S)-S-oxide reductase MsrA [Propionivibrio sp.]|uniref:peptide-methionine (S)-S-oxide reductase MsrA n=1 Tax=Propionivibrio sp. TaxID=2212460 RepID=UPI001A38192C|nr:peptide-methionine (S)-S-oxide reductase MsrA [Propionivibrio sp.]MBL8413829.1 peptide-methionine (S)-S-oxide reductase MsrA [Propionivibrio sp.]